MKIHLIAIGGAIMHNMAIALHKKGYEVSGSDDVIFEPALSRLKKHNLLPEFGWDANKITPDIDIVILGMHARADNPELLKAQELGLRIVSFPEFIYEQSRNKLRVVIAGSHGKTTVTAMVMHVLRNCGKEFDYAVGSSIQEFEDSVKLTENAPAIIIEGDEYLTSPIDRRPKFMWYDPQIALINGISWDHINVFPTYEIYKKQFEDFIASMKPGAILIYHQDDAETKAIVDEKAGHLKVVPARVPQFSIRNDKTVVSINGNEYTLEVFGEHNLQNLAGAQIICSQLGVNINDFWKAAATFRGAGKRMEPVPNKHGLTIFRDFAHAPSKVKATVEAVKKQFADKRLFAVLELHTFSSLNKDFIKEYADSLAPADEALVYVDNHALQMKGGDTYTEDQIRQAFNRQDIIFIDKGDLLKQKVLSGLKQDNVLLLMSSGNLGGMNIAELAEQKTL
jgi:UDP-N-acetylmuramate: L-alanyl-gamma-D-glutamyl-meso-diaminopimelate ligase